MSTAVDVAGRWQARIDQIMELDRRLQLLEAYISVLEERMGQHRRGVTPGPRLHLVLGEEPGQ